MHLTFLAVDHEEDLLTTYTGCSPAPDGAVCRA